MAKAVRNTKFLRAVVMKLFFVFSNINTIRSYIYLSLFRNKDFLKN